MKQAIYEPTRKAAEFAELALNLYDGCVHGCQYCYVPGVLHKDKNSFHHFGQPRLSLDDVKKSAEKYGGDHRRVLLSFTSDPLQGEPNTFTYEVIQALHDYALNVTVLTKSNGATVLYYLTDSDELAVTLTYTGTIESRAFEPFAALPAERILLLIEAHRAGIPTWVSLEPVINLVNVLSLIDATHPYTGHYKIGKMNYQHDSVNWKRALPEIEGVLRRLGKSYYIKSSIARLFGKEGYWWKPESISEAEI